MAATPTSEGGFRAFTADCEIVRWLGIDDPTTRRRMEELLAKEEEHADDMAKLLSRFGK